MRSVIAVVIMVLAFAALPLDAHIVIPAEFREVVADSNLIVRGRVTDVRSIRVPGAGIDSIATVAVESVLKGHANGFVYVRVPGGLIGNRRVVMSGAPTFRNGQHIVLFLRPSAHDTSFRPIGLTMGVYPVVAESSTGRLVVQPPIVAGRNAPEAGRTARGDPRRQTMSISEFESLVRLVVAVRPGSTDRGGVPAPGRAQPRRGGGR